VADTDLLEGLTSALWENTDALEYLEGRGLSLNTIAEARFGYVEKGRFRNSISIPYFDAKGRHRITRYRTLELDADQKYSVVKGTKTHLYGVEDVNEPVVFITEGEFDRWILKQLDLKAVAVSGATHFQRPWRFLFRNCDLVLIVTDNDPSNIKKGREVGQAGQRAAQRIAAWIGTVTNVDVVELPPRTDVTDLFLSDPDTLRSLCELPS